MERQDVRININKHLGHKFMRLEILINCGYDGHRIADLPVCIEQGIQSFYGLGGNLQVTQSISCVVLELGRVLFIDCERKRLSRQRRGKFVRTIGRVVGRYENLVGSSIWHVGSWTRDLGPEEDDSKSWKVTQLAKNTHQET